MIKPVIVDTTGGRVVGPVIPVDVLPSAGGLPVEGKIQRVVAMTQAEVVAQGLKVVGSRPIPVVLATGISIDTVGGPAIPVIVMSGSLSTGPTFAKQTGLATAPSASWNVPVTSNAGALLVALVGVRSASSVSVSTITDSAGNVWTKINSAFHVGVNGRIELWYAKNAAPITSITITPTGSVAMAVNVVEFAGIDPVNALDKNATADNNAVTTFDSGTTTATVQAVEVSIVAGAHTTANTETLDTAGYVPLTRVGAAATCIVIGAYRITTAIGAQRATWTMNVATTGGGAIATFDGA